ncbi:MAG: RHS repeat-associated core domain-containing protein, partial [candidate division WOR-3 bacterium]
IPNLVNNFIYNPAGQIIKIQRPNMVIDTFIYDNRLRPTQIRTKNTETMTDILKLGYWYEPNSNVDSIADYLNSQYSQGFAYDVLNRLTNVYSTGGNQSFTYDAVGNRLSKSGSNYTYYSGTNKLQTDHRNWTYYYDNNGNITSRSDGANFVYDWNNRLIQYTKGIQNLNFAYNASGLRVKKHYVENTAPPEGQGELGLLFTDGTNDLGIKSKGVDSVYNKGRDIEKVWVKADGQYYQFAIMYKHLFGETGKMKLFITLDIDTIPNSGRITLPEDTLTRVSRKCAWEYCVYIGDNDYGLYSKNGIKVSMPYGMSVVKTSGPAGIIKVKILKSLLSDAPILRCTVASFNPNQIPNPNPDTIYQGGSSASDVYPGSPEIYGGEIPGYVQVSSGGVAPTGATVEYTVYYVYDGINPILELSPNNSVLAKYVYAGGLHIAKVSGADTSWYHCDALGSPRKMTNESGTVVWTGAYQPFGEMLAGSGNVHGFTGKELDAESGLNYFCQRYYDSQIGRFMTRDLIPTPAFSSYSYCLNNPLKYIDIDGAKIKYKLKAKNWGVYFDSWAMTLMPDIWYLVESAPEEISVWYGLPPWVVNKDPFTGGGFFSAQQSIGIHRSAYEQGRYGNFSLEQIFCHELWHAYFYLYDNPFGFGTLYEEEMWIYNWMGQQGWLDYNFLRNIGENLKNKGYMRMPPSGKSKSKKTSYYRQRPYNKFPISANRREGAYDPLDSRGGSSYWYWLEQLLESEKIESQPKDLFPPGEKPEYLAGGGV